MALSVGYLHDPRYEWVYQVNIFPTHGAQELGILLTPDFFKTAQFLLLRGQLTLGVQMLQIAWIFDHYPERFWKFRQFR